MEGEESRINNTDLVVDRISLLPDSILGHILSFLPTKEAVGTTILSKSWKFVWVAVPNLDFYYRRRRLRWKIDENMAFVRFVDKVLLHPDAGSLNKFSLSWHSCISSHVILWIKNAITRNVRELYLSVGKGAILKIPISGFNCNSLQYLKVRPLTFHYDATLVCLPRLESLILHDVHFTSKEACEKLISGCPMLHCLKLTITTRDFHAEDAEDADDDFMYIISSASLRCLDIYSNYSTRLKLKAPSLEYLRLCGCISDVFVEKSLSSLVHADFDINLDKDGHAFPSNSMVEAVRAFDCAKFLSLSAYVVWVLSHATISLSTEFVRLVKLSAGAYCSSLQDIIQSSSNLEALSIYEGWRARMLPHNHPRWNALVEVPGCLSNNLKKVRLDGYKGLEDEREMIRYMLKHGSVLEVMQISCGDEGVREELELLQEICEFPRKSPDCKVQFCVWRLNRRFKPLLCEFPTWPETW